MIRPGGIGDCILSLPAIEFLRTDYTEVWVPSAVTPLLRFADHVRGIASTGLDLLGLPGVPAPPALIEELRAFDSIVSWYGTNRPQFRESVEQLGLAFRFHSALPPDGLSMHAADFFAGQVGCATPAVPTIPVGARPHDAIVIHPFSGSARKNWPLHRFRELAARLPGRVVFCAGPEEMLPDAIRFTDLYALGEWLAGARMYIGNDSGISHLAAAVAAPSVAIFGPTDPNIWAPRGPRAHVVQGVLGEISVQRVEDAVLAAFQ